jgi:hypothetical protein
VCGLYSSNTRPRTTRHHREDEEDGIQCDIGTSLPTYHSEASGLLLTDARAHEGEKAMVNISPQARHSIHDTRSNFITTLPQAAATARNPCRLPSRTGNRPGRFECSDEARVRVPSDALGPLEFVVDLLLIGIATVPIVQQHACSTDLGRLWGAT